MDDRWDTDGVDDLAAIDGDDLELELVGAAVRNALVRPIDPATARRLVQLMLDAHRDGPARRRGAPRDRLPRREVRRMAWPIVAGIAAAALAAAASTDALPSPVQRRLADAAAEIGIHLPGRNDGRGPSRVTTPVLPTPTIPPPTAPPTTTPTTAPSAPTAPATTPAAPVATTPTPTTTRTTVARPAPTTMPVASTTSSAPTTSTTPSTPHSTACVNPVLVSVTATLLPGDRSVSVVITTTGNVPYMSATVAGMTGVVDNLQPNPNGFTGTVTAPAPITAGSVLEIGSCGNRIRANTVIQP